MIKEFPLVEKMKIPPTAFGVLLKEKVRHLS